MSIVSDLRDIYGNNITATEVKKYARDRGISYPTVTRKLEQYKVKRGTWNLTIAEELEKALSVAAIPAVQQNLVPSADPNFIPFGNFNRVKKILKSSVFYPLFITGLSGNGKTVSVEQACAQLGRELIRVNITIETDEDDLIGGFRLVDGNTVWHNGPVIELLSEVLFFSLTRSTSLLTKFCAFRAFLKARGCSSRKWDAGSLLLRGSRWLLLPTRRARVLMTDVLSGPTYSTSLP